MNEPKDTDPQPNEQPQQPNQSNESEVSQPQDDSVPAPPPSPYADQIAAQTTSFQLVQPYGAGVSQPQSAQFYGADAYPPPQPTPPYGQPAQPYGASQPAQPYGAPQPTPPYGQQGARPYQQPPIPPAQPPYGQVYGQSPYPPAQPPKKKAWPWVLTACLLLFVLGSAGCTGCMACSVLSNSISDELNSTYRESRDQSDNGYGYSYEPPSGYDYPDSSTSSSLYTRSEIEELAEEAFGELTSMVEEGRCTPGIYEVGTGKDIAPGFYYLGGSQTEESNYWVFDQEDETGSYEVDDLVVYFGNYFTQLEEGDLIVYAAPADAHMYAATNEPLMVSAPYQSGVYRVGIDISAGTYRVNAQAEAAATTSNESAAYVMKNLEFDDDSIVETKYVIAGGSQTITVTDGQYVELFAATMEPVMA